MTEQDDRKPSVAPDQDKLTRGGATVDDVSHAARLHDTSAAGDKQGTATSDDSDDAARRDDIVAGNSKGDAANDDSEEIVGDDADDSDDAAGGDAERDPQRAEFLEDLPDAPELRPLIEAFAEGNYARLRSLERELRTRSTDPELLALARELVERTEPDPLAKKLLAVAIVFFLLIVGWVYLHHVH